MTCDEINTRYQAKVESAKAFIADPFELRLYMLVVLEQWRTELEEYRDRLRAIVRRD